MSSVTNGAHTPSANQDALPADKELARPLAPSTGRPRPGAADPRPTRDSIEACAANSGSIELIIGPMYSEKTTTMLARVRRAAFAGTSTAIIKWVGDVRYEAGPVVATHAETRQETISGSESCGSIRIIVTKTLAAATLSNGELVVGVDEGQFYPDLIEQCLWWAREGRRVIIAALDGDFAARPFGLVCELVPHCEDVIKLRGVCMRCRERDSAFTERLGGGTEIIQEGGREFYWSVCRQCYYR